MKTFNISFSLCLLFSISILSVNAQCPASAKINEFHYDNAGGDLNEFVEIALPTGADPTQIQIDLYNGSNGASYNSVILSAAEFVGSDGTFDYYVWSPGSIQNGNDGIAVSCIDGTQFQFITYEGPFMATDGPFASVMGIDVGVEETGTTTDAQSIMCDGSGNFLTGCTADAGAANDLSTCGAAAGCTDVNACNYDANATADDGSCYNIGDACNDNDGATINDIYIDCNTCQGESTGILNCGAPAWEAVAVTNNSQSDVWTAITNGWSMNGFCGGGCAEQVEQWLIFGPFDMTNTTVLDLSFFADQNFGTTDLNIYYTSDYSSACPATTTWTLAGTVADTGDTDPGNVTIDLSAATGTAVYIGIEYNDDGVDGYSNWDLTDFQLLGDVCPAIGTPVVSNCDTGSGCTNTTACNYDPAATIDDGTCFNIGDACDDGNANTTGDVYVDCTTCEGTPIVAGNCPTSAKINEFHYDNAGGDLNEFVEIALPAGSDPTQIQIDLYNGTNGTSYNSIILSSAEFVSTDGTFDYYVWNVVPQNGNDGIATSCIDGTQYQFITYEGAFMATDGPFAGVMGVDVGVEETSATTDTQSIMCDGTGNFLANCTADPGAANDLSSCGSVAGCTDVNACNYDATATSDDGSCFNIGDSCDDGNANTTGDIYTDCATCTGTCPLGNAGDPCDDGDPNTENDAVTAACACAGTPIGGGTCPASAKINEFHYDNAGGDVNEFVEIALPTGSDPTQVQVDLYNGSNGTSYNMVVLSSAEFVSTDGTFDYYVWNVVPQNGNDGIAVSCLDGTQYQFITYEGAFMATDGPFAGVMGIDVGVEEPADASETNSIMCDGTGNFLANCTADPGMANDLTTCSEDIAGCTDPNACNYDMTATTDDGSCFSTGDACDDGDPTTSGDVYVDCMTCQGSDVPVPGCTDSNACNYDPAATTDNGSCFSTGDACDDGDPNTNNDVYIDCTTCAGMAPVVCPASAKINEFHYDNAGGDVNEFVEIALPAGADPTAVQVDLYNGSNGQSYDSVVLSSADFVSTDGTFDYYVWNVVPQNGNDGIAVSCLDGTQYQFITYEGAFMATDGPFAGVMGTDVGVEEPADAAETNSIMCDGTGTFLGNCTADPGMANDLTTCSEDIAGCTDANACNYDMTATTDDGSCFSTGDACDDGDPNTNGDVYVDCMTCQGSVDPVPGCTDTNACNYNAAATEDDGSCFSTGDACDDGDPNTNNDVYVDCDTCAGMTPVVCPASAKINEFHYDNAGGDVNEFVEIALPAGADPTAVQVDLYNGSNGQSYDSVVLSSADFVSTDGTFDYYVWNVVPQNGNDGIAVSCLDGTQYQFITYEGAFMATDGPFAGVMGIDVGVEEPADAAETNSIMCDGTGNFLANCTADAGFANDLLTCVADQPNCLLQSTACQACPANSTETSIDLTTGVAFNDGLELCAAFDCGNVIDPLPNYDPTANTGTWTLPAGVVNAFAVGGVNDLTLADAINGGCLTADLNIISGTTPFTIEFRIENGTGAPGNGGEALTFDVVVDGTGACSMGGDFSDGNAVNGFAFAPGTLYSVVIGVVDFTGNPVAADIVVEISNVTLNVCVSEVTCDPPVGEACDDGDPNTINDTVQADCSCIGEAPAVAGCLDVNASNYDPNADTDNGSCLYLCNENNLLDVTTVGPFDGGTGLSYGAPTGMGLLTGANDDFGGFTWNVNTDGLTIDQICLFYTFTVTGDVAAFPVNLEFRIQNDCGGFPCPWIEFNTVISGPGTYTLGGLLNTGNDTGFDPAAGNSQIVAAVANFSGTPLGGNVDVVFSDLCISDGNCVVEPTCDDPCAPNFGQPGTCESYDDTCNQDCTIGPFGGTWDATTCACINEITPVNGCTDANACNYDATANCDNGSCDLGNTACPDPCNEPTADDGCDITTDTFDPSTCTVTNEPNCPAGTTFNASMCNCDADPVLGCTDMDACNFDMNANTDNGSCVYADAATISTTSSTSICTDDGVDEPIDVTIDVAGQGDTGAWVITDENAIILALPTAPPFVLDGAGVGTCLIWYVNFSDGGFLPQVGDNAADLVAASPCAALSNSISVTRAECGNCAPNSGNFPWNGQ